VNEISKPSSSRLAADLSSLQDLLPQDIHAGVNDPCHGFTGGVAANKGHVIPHPAVFAIY
jgi:hypothetical protein